MVPRRSLLGILMVLLMAAPLAQAQAQPVEDGEQVEILRMSNPYTLYQDLPFDLEVTLKSHLDHEITVAVFVTLHESGSGCRGGGSSYSEVTQTKTPDGKINYIHETLRLGAGATVTFPGAGDEWKGLILEENGLPGDGPYELCYWIESPTKSQYDEQGNPKPIYPWFYDSQATSVEVRSDGDPHIRVDPPTVRGSVATETRFAVHTTLHNPFSESVQVRLTGTLKDAGVEGCDGPALATRILDVLEVRVPGDGDKTVSVLGDGSEWNGFVPGDAIPGSGQYLLCLQATPIESQHDGDTQGTTVYVRKGNQAPVGILEPGQVRWGPGDTLAFHLDANDGDGDPVHVAWAFAGGDAASGPDANFTVPFIGTFQLDITLDDGFEESRMTCLIPVPGDQTTTDNAIHACAVAPAKEDGRSIPAPTLLVPLLAALWLARKR